MGAIALTAYTKTKPLLLNVDLMEAKVKKRIRVDDGTLIGTTFFGGPPNNVFMTNWFDKKTREADLVLPD